MVNTQNAVTAETSTVSSNNCSSNALPAASAERAELLDMRRCSKQVKSVIPKRRQEAIKWYGWGYNDSEFYSENNIVHFRGEKYPLNNLALPDLATWVYKKFELVVDESRKYPQPPTEYPVPTVNAAFMRALQATSIEHSQDGLDRLVRCHGQTLHDVYSLWHNKFKRIPDLVVWPMSHADVERLVALAHEHNVMVIPYGGGTSVSGAITCPQQEKRMICALDTSQMNRLLWLNRENLTVCFESGIVGQDMERVLQAEGLTVGHEPDSYEFSTLGGWVATRASGMKKNTYGNIEDLVVQVRMVTPAGTLERECSAPRISCGPDFNHIILGSEGTLGVVTEVVLKVRPVPKVKRYGSLAFPDFECGVQFMREVARRRCQPSSVRLIDNEQFQLGQALKGQKSWFASMIDQLKRAYATSIKGVDLTKICAATLFFEGEEADVKRQESVIYEIAKRFRGFPAGGQNGEHGYILTFVIAYIRDYGLNQGIVGESFETSVPWDRCSTLCRNVKRRVELECAKHGVRYYAISCRVTQTYDAGACVYFYFGFRYLEMAQPVDVFEAIEASARDEMLACGGSISHHHGVGKSRSRWYRSAVTDTGMELYKATKRQLDPRNIFAIGNLLPEQEEEEEENVQSTTHSTRPTNVDVVDAATPKSKL